MHPIRMLESWAHRNFCSGNASLVITGRIGATLCPQVGKDAVVVEADAIKNMEGLFRSLSRLDMLDMLDRLNRDGDDLNRHMHEYSTKAAENMLVAAGALCFPALCHL